MSRDSENTASRGFAFGANIHVIDAGGDRTPGHIHMDNVEFKNFGKVNSDSYAIKIDYTGQGYDHPSSIIENCAFNAGYNLALRLEHTSNTYVQNNVAIGNFGGGIWVEEDCIGFTVNDNLVMATYQLPATKLSGYPWVRSVSAFSIYSPHGHVQGNVAAGSYDQGYSVHVKMFDGKAAGIPASVCKVTRTLAYEYDINQLTANRQFDNNEAVGCMGGLSIISLDETPYCAVVTGATV